MPDISRKVAKGSSCNGPLYQAIASTRAAFPTGKAGNAARKDGWAGVVLEPSGDQPVDGFLVDPHDLVDLDLLSGYIDRCLAEAGNSTPSVIGLPSSTSLATATMA